MSFVRIIKSSSLMAATSMVTMAASLMRGKLVAYWLGLSGVGILGWLNQSVGMLTQVAGLGLPTSAVRMVAAAEGEQAKACESSVARAAIYAAGFGYLMSILAAAPLVWLSFGSYEHLSIALICCLAIPAGIISGAWLGVIQAKGDSAKLAKSQVWSALGGLACFAMGVSFGNVTGLAWGLVCASTLPIIVNWRSRPKLIGALLQFDARLSGLIRTGLALLGTLVVSQVSAYLVRVLVLRELGVEEAGLYQAAFSISSALPAFVFTAMSAEYYPLVSSAKTRDAIGQAINTQIQAGIMLGLPILSGIILFGAQLLDWLYSPAFRCAEGLLCWMTLAIGLRLVSWPLGYWLLGHAKPSAVFLIEGTGAAIIPVFAWKGLAAGGLTGLGLASCVAALVYALIIIAYLRHKSGVMLSQTTSLFVLAASCVLALSAKASGLDLSPVVRAIALAALAGLSFIAYRTMARKDA